MKKNGSSVLRIENLKKVFPITKGILKREVGQIRAVDDVSFSVERGEILGLVGESGSGKSTLGRCAVRLMEPTSGNIIFEGQDLQSFSQRALRKLRTHIQMIFQDPLASLNPRKRVVENIGSALLYHKMVKNRDELNEKVFEILNQVGLPKEAASQYPHQFSGGQQQRISIGRAIALGPRLLICDEAVSALDLSVQAQILNLLFELKDLLNLSYLFISHDLSVVRNFCDRVLVMYGGKIVESGPANTLFVSPKHPYTQQLLSAIPKEHPREKKVRFPKPLSSGTPSPGGCPYYSRCPLAKPECKNLTPLTKQGHAKGHEYTCIY